MKVTNVLFGLLSIIISVTGLMGQTPTITDFTPKSVSLNGIVTITGTNFHTIPDSNIVYLGAVRATVIQASASQLQVLVPGGVSYAPVTVTTRNLTASSNLNFIPTFSGTALNANSFSENIDFSADGPPKKVLVCDFNNDSMPDVICSYADNNYSIYRNIGSSGNFDINSFAPRLNNTFGEGTYVGGITTVNDFAISDVNNDGKKDVIFILSQKKELTYPYPPYDSYYTMVVRFGVLVNTSLGNTISFNPPVYNELRNGFDDFLTCATEPIGVSEALEIEAADLNCDGKSDIVCSMSYHLTTNCSSDPSNYYSEMIGLENSSSGTTVSFIRSDILPLAYGSYEIHHTIANLDNDQKPDIIYSKTMVYSTSPYLKRATYILKNTNVIGGIINSFVSGDLDALSQSLPERQFIAVDMDKDGRNDIVKTNYFQGFIQQNMYLSGNLDFSAFSSSVSFNGYWYGLDPHICKSIINDVNGDSRPDIVNLDYSLNKIIVSQNYSSPGTIVATDFVNGDFVSLGGYPVSLAVNDLDGDGKPELIFGNSSGYLSVMHNLITSEFELDTAICGTEYDTIVFTGNIDANSIYTWDFDGATVVSGTGAGPYVIYWSSTGTKHVSLSVDNNGVITDVTKQVSVYPSPTSTFYLPQYIYINDTNNVVYTGNASAAASYTWNFDGGNILSGSGQGPYEVKWIVGGNRLLSLSVSENGCFSDTTEKLITVFAVFQEERICVVTVDQVSGKNMIVWEKTQGEDIASYIIYKEISTNFYSGIGNVSYYNLSIFVDNNSNPEGHPDKYKLSILDSYGNESLKSPYHKTIHLQASQGVPLSNINLSWTPYVDEENTFVPSLYYIYRGLQPSNLSLLDSVSGSITTYTDQNVFDVYYYMIGVTKENLCMPNLGKLNEYNGSLSNMKDISGLVNAEVISLYNNINIFPNPACNSIYIDAKEKAILEIVNVQGQILDTKSLTDKTNNIDISKLASGVYSLRIITDKGIAVRKLIKQ